MPPKQNVMSVLTPIVAAVIVAAFVKGGHWLVGRPDLHLPEVGLTIVTSRACRYKQFKYKVNKRKWGIYNKTTQNQTSITVTGNNIISNAHTLELSLPWIYYVYSKRKRNNTWFYTKDCNFFLIQELLTKMT